MAAAGWDFDHLKVSCPRQRPNQAQILNIFQMITPPECEFKPIRIWARETKKKKSPCSWCVLYSTVNGIYFHGIQAKQLKEKLNKFTPPNCRIIDYEFYKNDYQNELGWLMIWKVDCQHSPNFYKNDKASKQLPIMEISRML